MGGSCHGKTFLARHFTIDLQPHIWLFKEDFSLSLSLSLSLSQASSLLLSFTLSVSIVKYGTNLSIRVLSSLYARHKLH